MAELDHGFQPKMSSGKPYDEDKKPGQDQVQPSTVRRQGARAAAEFLTTAVASPLV